ncbi:short-chain dehydrogenase/reductase SDR [Clostridium tetani]|uniref:hypothetical protein n=1 Tax=Clostridium tetani TaxID=1513 RepID=UPI000E16CBA6|nr:short-chain dehydrogenase/reductase SDR [Clostridium tetani]
MHHIDRCQYVFKDMYQFGITTNAVCLGLFESEMTADTLFKAEEFMKMYNALCPASRPGARGELNAPILLKFQSKVLK